MNDIDTLIVGRYDEQIDIYDGEQLVFKGICDDINITEKVEEMYAATVIRDKSSYISGSSSIEGKIKISAKNNSVKLLLDCIEQNKKLTLHYRDNNNAICVVPFSGYYYHINVFTYDTLHIINFFAKEILIYSNEDYRKKFSFYDGYENDFKNKIKTEEKLVTDVSKVMIITPDKTVTCDDISSVRVEECEEKIQNEYGEETRVKKGYYFRFYTCQYTYIDELYYTDCNLEKIFNLFYKDNGKYYQIMGNIDYLNAKTILNDSYIQIFLKDFTIKEDTPANVYAAQRLDKEEVKKLENVTIFNPLTTPLGTISTTGVTCDYKTCLTDSPIVSSANYNSITFGNSTFSPEEVGQALNSLINKNKTAIEENKEDKSMFNKIFDKYKFGEVKTNNIAYTINGLAFKGADSTYAVYKDGTFINVGDMIIDMPIFVMPTSLKSIEIGDVIVHYGAGSDVFVIVTAIDKDNITVVDPWSKERKILIPEKSIFGFDFVAKVITPMGMFEKQANADNPFGNMLPFMMMGDGDNKDMMMLMMMSQGNINNQMLPLMFMGKGDNDMLKYMMFTQMNGIAAGTDKE